MPALFALAQHDALVEADTKLEPGERLFSFLDDLYLTTTKPRAREAFEVVTESVHRHAGVKTNLGKLKVWSRGGGDAPEGLESAWQGGKDDCENGLVVLGIPLGPKAFVEAFAEERLRKEGQLLDELPKLGDLQCAWVLLSQSAVPRAGHTVRILPPTSSQMYEEKHDAAVWKTFCKVFGVGTLENDKLAKDVATLPGPLDGMGLRAAVRTAP